MAKPVQKLSHSCRVDPGGPTMIEAEKPGGERVFVAVDPRVRFTEGKVSDLRLGAVLAPFASEAEARMALRRAGVVIL